MFIVQVVKKFVFLGREATLEAKLEALAEVYELDATSKTIALKLSTLTQEKVSRAAVIGFYDRHRQYLSGMPLRGGDQRRVRKRSPKPFQDLDGFRRLPEQVGNDVFSAPKRRPNTLSKPHDDDADSKRLPLAELEARMCRWPTHETMDGHVFCGHRTRPLFSYCDAHHERQYTKGYRPRHMKDAPSMQLIAPENPKETIDDAET